MHYDRLSVSAGFHGGIDVILPACICIWHAQKLFQCQGLRRPDHLTGDAEIGGYDANTIAIIAAAVVIAVTAASLPDASWGLPDPQDTLPWEWNASSVGSFWSRRPVAVARRSVAVTLAGLTVGIGLLLDRASGRCPATFAVLSLLRGSVVLVVVEGTAFLVGDCVCPSNRLNSHPR